MTLQLFMMNLPSNASGISVRVMTEIGCIKSSWIHIIGKNNCYHFSADLLCHICLYTLIYTKLFAALSLLFQ